MYASLPASASLSLSLKPLTPCGVNQNTLLYPTCYWPTPQALGHYSRWARYCRWADRLGRLQEQPGDEHNHFDDEGTARTAFL